MRISVWSSDVCSSDLRLFPRRIEGSDSDGPLADWAVFNRVAGGTGQAARLMPIGTKLPRSEERRVGKECFSTCRSRCSQYHSKNTQPYIRSPIDVLIALFNVILSINSYSNLFN